MPQPEQPNDGIRAPLADASTGEWDDCPPLPAGVPAHLGRFRIRKVLGEGAFGRVYLAFDPELERPVAIKVPHREGLSPAFRERFLREARATATIHHPNVCPVYDVGTEGDLPYIVMHFVVGGTLAGLLDKLEEPLPPRHALILARKLALGMAKAHACGVIHRDLKPQNILYDQASREVLITDFGLARISGNALQTADGAVFGTPAYMSPEQARGKQEHVGPLSDVYSLGVILYQMLTGRLPFTGSTFELLIHHWETTPQPPSAFRPGLDPLLDAIVLKAMAKQPADRYPSAQAFATVLAEHLRTLPGGEADEHIFGSLAPSPSGALAAAGLHPTVRPDSTSVDEERLRCPGCRAPVRVVRGATESVDCSLCGTRFTAAEGRAAQAGSVTRAVPSGGAVWSPVGLEANQRRAPGAPGPHDEWLPVARGLRQSAYGVLTSVAFFFAFIGVAIAAAGHILDRPVYLVAAIAAGLGQGAGFVLMGLGRRRAAGLPPGLPGRTSGHVSAFAAWLAVPCAAACYVYFISQTTLAPLPISLAFLAVLTSDYWFVRYLSAIAPHIGPHFPLTQTQIARMYLRVSVWCAIVSVIVSGVSLVLTQKHAANGFLIPSACIGFVCVPVGFVMSVWLNISAARIVERHAHGNVP